MKKIFAKELAALAVLALAFTGCNTAFDGTNANFSEKESEYTDRSGATLIEGVSTAGSVSSSGSINNTNKKNVISVTVNSYSKLDTSTEKDAILFQQLTNNTTNAAFYPTRGATLPKTLIKTNESGSAGSYTTVFTYEVDGTGVTANKIALFVDAAKLKTKGGSAALNLDRNTKRGEESDCYIEYLLTNGTTTTITGTENFRPTYGPTTGITRAELSDSTGKATGVTRINVGARNKNAAHPTLTTADWENGLAAGLNDCVTLQYREPGKREYETKKLSFTYHDADSTAMTTDPYDAHTYTADFGPLAIGTVWRVVMESKEGITAPAWYKEVYGHPAIVYSAGSGVGAKSSSVSGTYVLHSSVPSYIVVSATEAVAGPDATSTYVPSSFVKTNTSGTNGIKELQKTFFQPVEYTDNWIEVKSVANVELDPTAAKDFIVVDANNKKVAADVDVITYSYNDSNTLSGKVQYVKITLKDVRYRNYASATTTTNPGTLKVLVGSGTKIKENKKYPAQLTFGQWKDIVDDDASGYVQIN